MVEIPTIPEFFRGSKIFITGGSGFMGKVLIEKLLRSCPDLNTIYLLLRNKKGKDVSTRIRDITDPALFDRLKQENPDALNKLVAVSGDVKELGLGLSEEDRRMLQDHVTVVFHLAASVRFDDSIREAVLINVRGTREVVNLALGMHKLEVFLHLSTTFCNFDKPEVLEKIYPAPHDWRTIIKMAEHYEDDYLLRIITPKLLGKLPNTYTYAKALSEHVINDHRAQLPLVIVRPSIVVPSVEEPMPGWVDNINGPFSITIGVGKAVIMSTYGDPMNCLDYVPVDTAIKSMICIAWHRAFFRIDDSLPVYNCSSMLKPANFTEYEPVIRPIFEEYPFENILWYPNAIVTSNWMLHYTRVMLFQVLPAIFIDGILRLKGNKPMLLKLQRKIFIANMSLAVFILTNIHFCNKKFLQICADLNESDRTDFVYDKVIDDLEGFMRTASAGGRLYLLKEPPSSIPQSKIHYRRMYWLHQVTKTLFYTFMFWFLNIGPRIVSSFHTCISWID